MNYVFLSEFCTNTFENWLHSFHHHTVHFEYQKHSGLKLHGHLLNNKSHTFRHIKHHVKKCSALFGTNNFLSKTKERICHLICFTFRCITCIMNLLQMSSNRIPAADDLIPVLIFVVIMVYFSTFGNYLNVASNWNNNSISLNCIL